MRAKGVCGAEDPWGVGPGEDTEVGMRRRLLEMMKQGGCPQPNKVCVCLFFKRGLVTTSRLWRLSSAFLPVLLSSQQCCSLMLCLPIRTGAGGRSTHFQGWWVPSDNEADNGTTQECLMGAGRCIMGHSCRAPCMRSECAGCWCGELHAWATGMDPSGSIKPTDILTVRECGNSIVDTFRLRAIKARRTGHASWRASSLHASLSSSRSRCWMAAWCQAFFFLHSDDTPTCTGRGEPRCVQGMARIMQGPVCVHVSAGRQHLDAAAGAGASCGGQGGGRHGAQVGAGNTAEWLSEAVQNA
jgi:hypothetical protein